MANLKPIQHPVNQLWHAMEQRPVDKPKVNDGIIGLSTTETWPGMGYKTKEDCQFAIDNSRGETPTFNTPTASVGGKASGGTASGASGL